MLLARIIPPASLELSFLIFNVKNYTGVDNLDLITTMSCVFLCMMRSVDHFLYFFPFPRHRSLFVTHLLVNFLKKIQFFFFLAICGYFFFRLVVKIRFIVLNIKKNKIIDDFCKSFISIFQLNKRFILFINKRRLIFNHRKTFLIIF